MIPGIETFHPRESWQDPKYPVFGPLDDPTNNDTIVIHYTAADDLIDGDPGEHAENLPAYMRAMQRSYVLNRGYSLGYLFAVDWLGGVWQIRGWEYQSAANAGHNGHTWPILVLVDGADEATPEAVRSVQLIGYEAQRRANRPQVVKGHGQLRVETGVGTPTACPGAGLQAQVNNGTFNPQPPGTDIPVSSGVDMKYLNAPIRIYDTRPFGWLPAGEHQVDSQFPSAEAITVTLTVIGTGTPGFATLWGDGPRPNSSVINWGIAKDAIANTTTVRVVGGKFRLFVSSNVNVIMDVQGTQ